MQTQPWTLHFILALNKQYNEDLKKELNGKILK